MSGCSKCDLCKFSNPSLIMGSGPKHPKIMIINSAASDADEKEGQAVMEKIVKQQFELVGYNLDKVYYTNAIKCRTPKGYKVKVSEVKKCSEHLQREIKKLKPKYVLMLGAQACQSALNMKMGELQGTPYIKDGITYYSTYSPRVLYYDAAKAPQVEREIRNFLELTKGVEVNKKGKLNTVEVTSMKQLKELFKDYVNNYGYKSISYDIEATGLSRWDDVVTLFGFGNDKVQYQIPMNVNFGPLQYKPIAQINLIKYAIKEIKKFRWRIAANGKFDDLFLEMKYGDCPRVNFDTNLASHLHDENTPNGLKDSAIRELGAPNWDINSTLKKGQVDSKSQLKEFYKYNGYDIYYTHRLYKYYKAYFKTDKSLNKIFKYLISPAQLAYEKVEKKGIYINKESYNKKAKELYSERDRIVGELFELLPKKLRKKYKDINWRSTDQVNKLLFEDLGLKPLDRTPTGKPQVNDSVLKRLNTPFTLKMTELRSINTALQTFVEGWGSLFHPKDNGDIYVHPRFNLNGTVTGRTSCNGPRILGLISVMV